MNSSIETLRIPLEPEEHIKLGELIRAAELAKEQCSKYVDELGAKYSIRATSVNCSIGFENGFVIISEPRLVVKAS